MGFVVDVTRAVISVTKALCLPHSYVSGEGKSQVTALSLSLSSPYSYLSAKDAYHAILSAPIVTRSIVVCTVMVCVLLKDEIIAFL